MFFLVRCPICGCSEIVKEEDMKYRCYECGFKFSKNEADFGEIDGYEIRRR